MSVARRLRWVEYASDPPSAEPPNGLLIALERDERIVAIESLGGLFGTGSARVWLLSPIVGGQGNEEPV